MKKSYLIIVLMLVSQTAVVVYASGPDNPLYENSYEWKGRGWASLFGVGVNAPIDQTVIINLPTWVPSISVEQAYLYVNIIDSGEPSDPLANLTVSMNGIPLGTSPPYSWDFVNGDFGDFWNIYRWNVTDIVETSGGGLQTVGINSTVRALIGNVLVAVVFSDPSASPNHIILNDGIEALISSNQTTIFHDVGPSWYGAYLYTGVTGGEYNEDPMYEEKVLWNYLIGSGSLGGSLWNSTEGPYLDIVTNIFSFGSALPTSDLNVTVCTGIDDIGWGVSLLQAALRDVYAENQTHPNPEVVQGYVEPVEVFVGNSNLDYIISKMESFNVTLYVEGPYTGSVGKLNVTDLPGGNKTSIIFNWDTTGYPPGTYVIRAHADSDEVIPEFDEENNWCNATSTLRIMTPPVADADGPYHGWEGSPVIFDGSGSYDLDGTIVSYEWDLDDDGLYDEASGVHPTHTWCDDYVGQVGLNVTDDDGLFNTSKTTLTVSNVPPAITFFNMTYFNSRCDAVEVEFLAKFTDPGWCDTHTATWDWGDGETSPGVLVEENLEPDATGIVTGKHTYDDASYHHYSVTLNVYDDDGGVDTYKYRYITGPVGGQLIPSNINSIKVILTITLLFSSLIIGIKNKRDIIKQ